MTDDQLGIFLKLFAGFNLLLASFLVCGYFAGWIE